jgi:arsenite methyltransferase
VRSSRSRRTRLELRNCARTPVQQQSRATTPSRSARLSPAPGAILPRVRSELTNILADPVDGGTLVLEETQRVGDDVVTGTLRGAGGREYAIAESIPRFVSVDDADQAQTQSSFAFKWNKRDSFGSTGMQKELHAWLLDRYGFASSDEMRAFFASRERTLDAGCGAGFATSAWMDDEWSRSGAEWVGADISDAIDVARERLAAFGGTHFVQADVLHLPFRPQTFDVVFSEGVLHHTPSTEDAMKALVPLLRSGGELMVYVYRRKAPIREFTDDYVREQLAGLTPDEAWEALRPLTRLGQALAELEAEVEVPEDVPLLGIKAGRYDVQRLIYWNVAKLFWNPAMTFEENNHLNFDWYAPRYAWRHTEDEVRGWYVRAGLEITRFHTHEAGFTVRGVKA